MCTLQHSTSETTPSQKNMRMILSDYEAMDISFCNIWGHVHASAHGCTETEIYV